MADFMTRTKTTARHEFYLETPTNAVEFGKALNAAEKAALSAGVVVYDNTIKVDVGDDEVIIYWEEQLS